MCQFIPKNSELGFKKHKDSNNWKKLNQVSRLYSVKADKCHPLMATSRLSSIHQKYKIPLPLKVGWHPPASASRFSKDWQTRQEEWTKFWTSQ